jgi:DNA-binding IclR family transcriptional regulator
MGSPEDVVAFIASSFRSVWALELLLLLRREGRSCSEEELVTALRASPSVVEKALDSLMAAGLAATDGDRHAYMPSSAKVGALVEETEQLYRSRPNRVRRLIVASSSKSLAAFSDAFRLKD